jgi:hypothetical protein
MGNNISIACFHLSTIGLRFNHGFCRNIHLDKQEELVNYLAIQIYFDGRGRIRTPLKKWVAA